MDNRDRIELNLKYKGQRNYIQGGDVYNAVESLAETITGLENSFVSNLAFRKFARKDCDLCIEQPTELAPYIAKGKIADAGGREVQIFWILESDRLVSKRYEFNEDEIVGSTVIKDKQICLYDKSVYTPIEEVIALTKALNYKLHPDITGKWVFGQLDLISPLTYVRNQLHIEFKTVRVNRFSVNEIYEDDNFIGDIRFIVGEP